MDDFQPRAAVAVPFEPSATPERDYAMYRFAYGLHQPHVSLPPDTQANIAAKIAADAAEQAINPTTSFHFGSPAGGGAGAATKTDGGGSSFFMTEHLGGGGGVVASTSAAGGVVSGVGHTLTSEREAPTTAEGLAQFHPDWNKDFQDASEPGKRDAFLVAKAVSQFEEEVMGVAQRLVVGDSAAKLQRAVHEHHQIEAQLERSAASAAAAAAAASKSPADASPVAGAGHSPGGGRSSIFSAARSVMTVMSMLKDVRGKRTSGTGATAGTSGPLSGVFSGKNPGGPNRNDRTNDAGAQVISLESLPPITPLDNAPPGRFLVRGIYYMVCGEDPEQTAFYGCVENLHKAVASELRVLRHIWALEVPGIAVPLCTVVQLYGFRIFAVAEMPITQESLCAGPHGEREYKALPLGHPVYRSLSTLSEALHLPPIYLSKEHQTQLNDFPVFCSPECVTHASPIDKRVYVFELARAMPAADPGRKAGLLPTGPRPPTPLQTAGVSVAGGRARGRRRGGSAVIAASLFADAAAAPRAASRSPKSTKGQRGFAIGGSSSSGSDGDDEDRDDGGTSPAPHRPNRDVPQNSAGVRFFDRQHGYRAQRARQRDRTANNATTGGGGGGSKSPHRRRRSSNSGSPDFGPNRDAFGSGGFGSDAANPRNESFLSLPARERTALTVALEEEAGRVPAPSTVQASLMHATRRRSSVILKELTTPPDRSAFSAQPSGAQNDGGTRKGSDPSRLSAQNSSSAGAFAVLNDFAFGGGGGRKSKSPNPASGPGSRQSSRGSQRPRGKNASSPNTTGRPPKSDGSPNGKNRGQRTPDGPSPIGGLKRTSSGHNRRRGSAATDDSNEPSSPLIAGGGGGGGGGKHGQHSRGGKPHKHGHGSRERGGHPRKHAGLTPPDDQSQTGGGSSKARSSPFSGGHALTTEDSHGGEDDGRSTNEGQIPNDVMKKMINRYRRKSMMHGGLKPPDGAEGDAQHQDSALAGEKQNGNDANTNEGNTAGGGDGEVEKGGKAAKTDARKETRKARSTVLFGANTEVTIDQAESASSGSDSRSPQRSPTSGALPPKKPSKWSKLAKSSKKSATASAADKSGDKEQANGGEGEKTKTQNASSSAAAATAAPTASVSLGADMVPNDGSKAITSVAAALAAMARGGGGRQSLLKLLHPDSNRYVGSSRAAGIARLRPEAVAVLSREFVTVIISDDDNDADDERPLNADAPPSGTPTTASGGATVTAAGGANDHAPSGSASPAVKGGKQSAGSSFPISSSPQQQQHQSQSPAAKVAHVKTAKQRRETAVALKKAKRVVTTMQTHCGTEEGCLTPVAFTSASTKEQDDKARAASKLVDDECIAFAARVLLNSAAMTSVSPCTAAPVPFADPYAAQHSAGPHHSSASHTQSKNASSAKTPRRDGADGSAPTAAPAPVHRPSLEQCHPSLVPYAQLQRQLFALHTQLQQMCVREKDLASQIQTHVTNQNQQTKQQPLLALMRSEARRQSTVGGPGGPMPPPPPGGAGGGTPQTQRPGVTSAGGLDGSSREQSGRDQHPHSGRDDGPKTPSSSAQTAMPMIPTPPSSAQRTRPNPRGVDTPGTAGRAAGPGPAAGLISESSISTSAALQQQPSIGSSAVPTLPAIAPPDSGRGVGATSSAPTGGGGGGVTAMSRTGASAGFSGTMSMGSGARSGVGLTTPEAQGAASGGTIAGLNGARDGLTNAASVALFSAQASIAASTSSPIPSGFGGVGNGGAASSSAFSAAQTKPVLGARTGPDASFLHVPQANGAAMAPQTPIDPSGGDPSRNLLLGLPSPSTQQNGAASTTQNPPHQQGQREKHGGSAKSAHGGDKSQQELLPPIKTASGVQQPGLSVGPGSGSHFDSGTLSGVVSGGGGLQSDNSRSGFGSGGGQSVTGADAGNNTFGGAAVMLHQHYQQQQQVLQQLELQYACVIKEKVVVMAQKAQVEERFNKALLEQVTPQPQFHVNIVTTVLHDNGVSVKSLGRLLRLLLSLLPADVRSHAAPGVLSDEANDSSTPEAWARLAADFRATTAHFQTQHQPQFLQQHHMCLFREYSQIFAAQQYNQLLSQGALTAAAVSGFTKQARGQRRRVASLLPTTDGGGASPSAQGANDPNASTGGFAGGGGVNAGGGAGGSQSQNAAVLAALVDTASWLAFEQIPAPPVGTAIQFGATAKLQTAAVAQTNAALLSAVAAAGAAMSMDDVGVIVAQAWASNSANPLGGSAGGIGGGGKKANVHHGARASIGDAQQTLPPHHSPTTTAAMRQVQAQTSRAGAVGAAGAVDTMPPSASPLSARTPGGAAGATFSAGASFGGRNGNGNGYAGGRAVVDLLSNVTHPVAIIPERSPVVVTPPVLAAAGSQSQPSAAKQTSTSPGGFSLPLPGPGTAAASSARQQTATAPSSNALGGGGIGGGVGGGGSGATSQGQYVVTPHADPLKCLLSVINAVRVEIVARAAKTQLQEQWRAAVLNGRPTLTADIISAAAAQADGGSFRGRRKSQRRSRSMSPRIQDDDPATAGDNAQGGEGGGDDGGGARPIVISTAAEATGSCDAHGQATVSTAELLRRELHKLGEADGRLAEDSVVGGGTGGSGRFGESHQSRVSISESGALTAVSDNAQTAPGGPGRVPTERERLSALARPCGSNPSKLARYGGDSGGAGMAFGFAGSYASSSGNPGGGLQAGGGVLAPGEPYYCTDTTEVRPRQAMFANTLHESTAAVMVATSTALIPSKAVARHGNRVAGTNVSIATTQGQPRSRSASLMSLQNSSSRGVIGGINELGGQQSGPSEAGDQLAAVDNPTDRLQQCTAALLTSLAQPGTQFWESALASEVWAKFSDIPAAARLQEAPKLAVVYRVLELCGVCIAPGALEEIFNLNIMSQINASSSSSAAGESSSSRTKQSAKKTDSSDGIVAGGGKTRRSVFAPKEKDKVKPETSSKASGASTLGAAFTQYGAKRQPVQSTCVRDRNECSTLERVQGLISSPNDATGSLLLQTSDSFNPNLNPNPNSNGRNNGGIGGAVAGGASSSARPGQSTSGAAALVAGRQEGARGGPGGSANAVVSISTSSVSTVSQFTMYGAMGRRFRAEDIHDINPELGTVGTVLPTLQHALLSIIHNDTKILEQSLGLTDNVLQPFLSAFSANGGISAAGGAGGLNPNVSNINANGTVLAAPHQNHGALPTPTAAVSAYTALTHGPSHAAVHATSASNPTAAAVLMSERSENAAAASRHLYQALFPPSTAAALSAHVMATHAANTSASGGGVGGHAAAKKGPGQNPPTHPTQSHGQGLQASGPLTGNAAPGVHTILTLLRPVLSSHMSAAGPGGGSPGLRSPLSPAHLSPPGGVGGGGAGAGGVLRSGGSFSSLHGASQSPYAVALTPLRPFSSASSGVLSCMSNPGALLLAALSDMAFSQRTLYRSASFVAFEEALATAAQNLDDDDEIQENGNGAASSRSVHGRKGKRVKHGKKSSDLSHAADIRRMQKLTSLDPTIVALFGCGDFDGLSACPSVSVADVLSNALNESSALMSQSSTTNEKQTQDHQGQHQTLPVPCGLIAGVPHALVLSTAQFLSSVLEASTVASCSSFYLYSQFSAERAMSGGATTSPTDTDKDRLSPGKPYTTPRHHSSRSAAAATTPPTTLNDRYVVSFALRDRLGLTQAAHAALMLARDTSGGNTRHSTMVGGGRESSFMAGSTSAVHVPPAPAALLPFGVMGTVLRRDRDRPCAVASPKLPLVPSTIAGGIAGASAQSGGVGGGKDTSNVLGGTASRGGLGTTTSHSQPRGRAREPASVHGNTTSAPSAAARGGHQALPAGGRHTTRSANSAASAAAASTSEPLTKKTHAVFQELMQLHFLPPPARDATRRRRKDPATGAGATTGVGVSGAGRKDASPGQGSLSPHPSSSPALGSPSSAALGGGNTAEVEESMLRRVSSDQSIGLSDESTGSTGRHHPNLPGRNAHLVPPILGIIAASVSPPASPRAAQVSGLVTSPRGLPSSDSGVGPSGRGGAHGGTRAPSPSTSKTPMKRRGTCQPHVRGKNSASLSSSSSSSDWTDSSDDATDTSTDEETRVQGGPRLLKRRTSKSVKKSERSEGGGRGGEERHRQMSLFATSREVSTAAKSTAQLEGAALQKLIAHAVREGDFDSVILHTEEEIDRLRFAGADRAPQLSLARLRLSYALRQRQNRTIELSWASMGLDGIVYTPCPKTGALVNASGQKRLADTLPPFEVVSSIAARVARGVVKTSALSDGVRNVVQPDVLELGMSTGKIMDHHITTSSWRSNETRPGLARVGVDTGGAWEPETDDYTREWLSVKLTAKTNLWGVALEGWKSQVAKDDALASALESAEPAGDGKWVRTIVLMTSRDGRKWRRYDGPYTVRHGLAGAPATFRENGGANSARAALQDPHARATASPLATRAPAFNGQPQQGGVLSPPPTASSISTPPGGAGGFTPAPTSGGLLSAGGHRFGAGSLMPPGSGTRAGSTVVPLPPIASPSPFGAGSGVGSPSGIGGGRFAAAAATARAGAALSGALGGLGAGLGAGRAPGTGRSFVGGTVESSSGSSSLAGTSQGRRGSRNNSRHRGGPGKKQQALDRLPDGGIWACNDATTTTYITFPSAIENIRHVRIVPGCDRRFEPIALRLALYGRETTIPQSAAHTLHTENVPVQNIDWARMVHGVSRAELVERELKIISLVADLEAKVYNPSEPAVGAPLSPRRVHALTANGATSAAAVSLEIAGGGGPTKNSGVGGSVSPRGGHQAPGGSLSPTKHSPFGSPAHRSLSPQLSPRAPALSATAAPLSPAAKGSPAHTFLFDARSTNPPSTDGDAGTGGGHGGHHSNSTKTIGYGASRWGVAQERLAAALQDQPAGAGSAGGTAPDLFGTGTATTADLRGATATGRMQRDSAGLVHATADTFDAVPLISIPVPGETNAPLPSKEVHLASEQLPGLYDEWLLLLRAWGAERAGDISAVTVRALRYGIGAARLRLKAAKKSLTEQASETDDGRKAKLTATIDALCADAAPKLFTLAPTSTALEPILRRLCELYEFAIGAAPETPVLGNLLIRVARWAGRRNPAQAFLAKAIQHTCDPALYQELCTELADSVIATQLMPVRHLAEGRDPWSARGDVAGRLSFDGVDVGGASGGGPLVPEVFKDRSSSTGRAAPGGGGLRQNPTAGKANGPAPYETMFAQALSVSPPPPQHTDGGGSPQQPNIHFPLVHPNQNQYAMPGQNITFGGATAEPIRGRLFGKNADQKTEEEKEVESRAVRRTMRRAREQRARDEQRRIAAERKAEADRLAREAELKRQREAEEEAIRRDHNSLIFGAQSPLAARRKSMVFRGGRPITPSVSGTANASSDGAALSTPPNAGTTATSVGDSGAANSASGDLSPKARLVPRPPMLNPSLVAHDAQGRRRVSTGGGGTGASHDKSAPGIVVGADASSSGASPSSRDTRAPGSTLKSPGGFNPRRNSGGGFEALRQTSSSTHGDGAVVTATPQSTRARVASATSPGSAARGRGAGAGAAQITGSPTDAGPLSPALSGGFSPQSSLSPQRRRSTKYDGVKSKLDTGRRGSSRTGGGRAGPGADQGAPSMQHQSNHHDRRKGGKQRRGRHNRTASATDASPDPVLSPSASGATTTSGATSTGNAPTAAKGRGWRRLSLDDVTPSRRTSGGHDGSTSALPNRRISAGKGPAKTSRGSSAGQGNDARRGTPGSRGTDGAANSGPATGRRKGEAEVLYTLGGLEISEPKPTARSGARGPKSDAGNSGSPGRYDGDDGGCGAFEIAVPQSVDETEGVGIAGGAGGRLPAAHARSMSASDASIGAAIAAALVPSSALADALADRDVRRARLIETQREFTQRAERQEFIALDEAVDPWTRLAEQARREAAADRRREQELKDQQQLGRSGRRRSSIKW